MSFWARFGGPFFYVLLTFQLNRGPDLWSTLRFFSFFGGNPMRTSAILSLFALVFAANAYAGNAAVDAALVHPDRLEGDREIDARRKPDEVLAFFSIQPGMNVLELYAGGGYYSEILSYVVGEDGEVVAHNNSPYLQHAKDERQKRFTKGRLTNVHPLTAENNELAVPDNTFDTAVLILAFHDIYYVDEENGWYKIDGPVFLTEVYSSLKPGAVLGVVDHRAESGAPTTSGNDLHRIDPAVVKEQITAVGFVFDGESDALRNPDDDVTQPMYAEGIRGKTDRFIYRFRKP